MIGCENMLSRRFCHEQSYLYQKLSVLSIFVSETVGFVYFFKPIVVSAIKERETKEKLFNTVQRKGPVRVAKDLDLSTRGESGIWNLRNSLQKKDDKSTLFNQRSQTCPQLHLPLQSYENVSTPTELETKGTQKQKIKKNLKKSDLFSQKIRRDYFLFFFKCRIVGLHAQI